MMRNLVFVFILFFNVFLSTAQNSQWQQFGIEDGLPQSHITCISQDSIGYLWLGTKGNGLVRFDGREFLTYTQKDSLLSTFVNHLVFKNDRLFVGTNQGLGVYFEGKIKSYPSPKIRKIIDIKNDLFFATDSGIYLWADDYLLPLKIDTEIDINAVNDIAYYNNQYWICTKKGLYSSLSLTEDQNAVLQLEGNFSTVTPTYRGLFVTDVNKGIFKKTGKEFDFVASIQGINHILASPNALYISTSQNGILKLNTNLQIDRSFYNADLQLETIENSFIDQDKNIWIASQNKGLFKHTENNFVHFTVKNGLSSNRINAIQTQKRALWVASGNNGIQYRPWNSFLGSGIKELENTRINAIAIDSSENIWLGSQNKGLLLLKHQAVKDSVDARNKNGIINELNIMIPSYDFINIGEQLLNIGKSIQHIVANNDHVWIADGQQIHQLTTAEGIITKIQSYGEDNGLRDGKVTSLYIHDNILWYGTENGNLGRIKNGKLKDYYQIIGSNVGITSIAKKEDFLILGTINNGIWISSATNPKDIFELKGSKKLNSKNIRQLLYDKNGYLWVGTEKGLNKIVLENNSIKDVFYFSKNDGFTGVETTNNAIAQSEQGSIWFGTVNGLTKLEEAQTKASTKRPSIQFESIEVAYQKIDSINRVIPLSLNASENSLSFQFKTVDLNNPNDIEYQWKLNGNNSPWSMNTSIDFAQLDYGSYTFQVKSRNRDWIESTPVSFQFIIKKPWYYETWFYWTIGSGLFLFIIVIALLYTKNVQKKTKKKLESLRIENELISLEQKALQLQMNPHFVFNVLNSIKAMGTTGQLERMNETINEFAILLRGVLQHSREEYIDLKSEIQVISNYVLLEQKLRSNSFNLKIDIDINTLDLEEVSIPTMLIQPFIENSIKHAFIGSDKQGEIQLRLQLRKTYILCEIKDNGIGYKVSQKTRQKHHKSLALDVTQERLKSLIQYPNFIMKQTENKGQVSGTFVSFHMPFKTDF